MSIAAQKLAISTTVRVVIQPERSGCIFAGRNSMLKLLDYCAMLILSGGVVYLFQVTCTHFQMVISHMLLAVSHQDIVCQHKRVSCTYSRTKSWQRIMGTVEQPLENIGCVFLLFHP